MESIFYIFAFIFGAIVGSFLNVVIYRYNTGAPIVHGRSMCFSCGKKLSWYELIPIVSFVIQRGKCGTCKSKLSWQYPIVEITTGLLFLGVFLTGLPALTMVYLLTVVSILVVIAVYDMRHKIIPNGLVYAFIFLTLFALVFNASVTSFVFLWDWLAGPMLFLPFAALWFFSKGTWMGFGDAKLAWGIGWFLGLYMGASAIILSFWIGAIWGLALIGLGKAGGLFPRLKRFTIKSEIPFGPFLILGTLLVFFFGVDVFSLARIF